MLPPLVETVLYPVKLSQSLQGITLRGKQAVSYFLKIRGTERLIVD